MRFLKGGKGQNRKRPDNLYRVDVTDKSYAHVVREKAFADVKRQGEIEGSAVDPKNGELWCSSTGARVSCWACPRASIPDTTVRFPRFTATRWSRLQERRSQSKEQKIQAGRATAPFLNPYTIATARHQPALALAILIGKTATLNPNGFGIISRFARFSIWQYSFSLPA